MASPHHKILLILSILVLVTLACNMFTPEYEVKLKQEATQTTIAKKTARYQRKFYHRYKRRWLLI